MTTKKSGYKGPTIINFVYYCAGMLTTIFILLIVLAINNSIQKKQAVNETVAANGENIVNNVDDKETLYKAAKAHLDKGEYDEAIDGFYSLGEYSDSWSMYQESVFCKAEELLKQGDPLDAKKMFEKVSNYPGASTRIIQCDYNYGVQLFDAGMYDKARSTFEALEGYGDSAQRAYDCIFKIASQDALEDDYTTAGSYFSFLAKSPEWLNYFDKDNYRESPQTDFDYYIGGDIFVKKMVTYSNNYDEAMELFYIDDDNKPDIVAAFVGKRNQKGGIYYFDIETEKLLEVIDY